MKRGSGPVESLVTGGRHVEWVAPHQHRYLEAVTRTQNMCEAGGVCGDLRRLVLLDVESHADIPNKKCLDF